MSKEIENVVETDDENDYDYDNDNNNDNDDDEQIFILHTSCLHSTKA